MEEMKKHLGLFCLGLMILLFLSTGSAVAQGTPTSPGKRADPDSRSGEDRVRKVKGAVGQA